MTVKLRRSNGHSDEVKCNLPVLQYLEPHHFKSAVPKFLHFLVGATSSPLLVDKGERSVLQK